MHRVPFLLALVVVLVVASPASAAPSWLGETLPFGDVPAREADASVVVAPDGRAVFARFAPDGALEVRERPPGEPIGPAITLPPVTAAPQPLPNLQVLVGADGTAAVLFDAGAIRYAAMRAPGKRWTDPEPVSPSGVRAGQTAIAPDGELWVVAPALGDADALAVFRMSPGHAAQPASFPAPRAGARDLAPALTAPAAGGAHVIYLERGTAEAGAGCVTRTVVLAVDVPVYGDALPPTRLDAFDATGTGTPDTCQLTAGQVVLRPLLLAADATGADTAVYSVVSLDPFLTVTPFARHRERGATWPVAALEPAEPVSDGDAVAEKLIGGPGSPVVVLRAATGKSIAIRAGDRWTPNRPLFEDASSYEAARTGAGTTVFAWVDEADPARVVARVADADGVLGDPVELAGTGATLLAVGGDQRGDATALYTRPRGDAFVLAARDYGAEETPIVQAPPALPSVTPQPAPTTEPAVTPAVDRRAPLVGGASLSPKRPRAGRPIALVLATDEAGRAEITLTKTATGIRRGGRCVALAHRHGAPCTRTLARRTVSRPLPAGSTRVALPRLSAGTWTVAAVVTDAAGNASRPRTLRLHVAT